MNEYSVKEAEQPSLLLALCHLAVAIRRTWRDLDITMPAAVVCLFVLALVGVKYLLEAL